MSVVAHANGRDYANEGFGLRVSIVNEGLRALSVTRVRLLLDGKPLVTGTGYLADLRYLDRFMIEPAAVTDQQLNLPLSVQARSERNVAILFGDLRSTYVGTDGSRRLGAPATARERNHRIRERRFEKFAGSAKKHVRVTLEVKLAPGGIRRYRVQRLEGMTPRFNWQVFLEGTGKRVNAIAIRRKLGATGQADLLTLEVWSETGARIHRAVRRPIEGALPTAFPVAKLPAGQFVYAFSLAGRVASAGRFLSPDPCATADHLPELRPEDFDLRGRLRSCRARHLR